MSKSLLLNSLKCKCPRCGEGELFIDKNPYHLKMMSKMYQNCKICDLDFDQEPGFYWGAMYVSYGFTTLIAFVNTLWIYPIWGWEPWPYLLFITLLIVLVSPYNFRVSRAMWLGLSIKYFDK